MLCQPHLTQDSLGHKLGKKTVLLSTHFLEAEGKTHRDVLSL